VLLLAAAALALLLLGPLPPGRRSGRDDGGQGQAGPAGPARLDEQLIRRAAGELLAAAAQVDDGDPFLRQLDTALRLRTRAELAVALGEPGGEQLLEQATRPCQQLMADLLSRLGPARYRALAAALTMRTMDGLAQALPGLAAAGGLHPFLAGLAPGSEAHLAAVELYGSFLLRVALPSGLLLADGRADPDLLPFARTIVGYRLLEEPARLAGTPLALGDGEQRIFLRWRVERAAPASAEARQRALRELQQLEPGYRPPRPGPRQQGSDR